MSKPLSLSQPHASALTIDRFYSKWVGIPTAGHATKWMKRSHLKFDFYNDLKSLKETYTSEGYTQGYAQGYLEGASRATDAPAGDSTGGKK